MSSPGGRSLAWAIGLVARPLARTPSQGGRLGLVGQITSSRRKGVADPFHPLLDLRGDLGHLRFVHQLQD